MTYRVVSEDVRTEVQRRLALLTRLRQGETVFVPGYTSRQFGGYRTAAKANGKTMKTRQETIDGEAGTVAWWE